MTQARIYDYIAKAALDQYPIEGQHCFLGHSGSVTFRVETQAEKFLLRIHQAISGPQDDEWQRLEVIESELLWLAALHLDTKLGVQEPIKNRHDRWVTQVSVDETGEVFNCSLLRWIEGEILSEPTPQQGYQLGVLMAQLHQHSQQWQPPQNFVRPTYDQNRLKVARLKLQPAVTQGLISTENYSLLKAAACQVQSLMKTLGQTRDIWGLIHADLHDGNYLSHNQELRPIDFARCGFGYYLYDVASSLQYLPPTIRSSFLEGYQTVRRLPENYLPVTEGFFVMALIDVLAFHASNPQEHEWLIETVKYVAGVHIPRYLEDESFLFDKY